MSGAERQTDRPCEDCGAAVLTGREPVSAASEPDPEPELVAAEDRATGSE